METLVNPRPFATGTSMAACSVVVVTYNSSRYISALIDSLRRCGDPRCLAVTIIDNGSTDETQCIVRASTDVALIEAPGNIGYAGALNLAFADARVTKAPAILVLNPDLGVENGAIDELLAKMQADSSIGVCVPRLTESDGSLSLSLRKEPSIRRAIGDTLFGNFFQARGAAWAETVYDTEAYEESGPIEWATGAAMLISAACSTAVGRWDERFFLYSEETDFFRRSRDLGWRCVNVPNAVMRHHGAGSGSSNELAALVYISKIRYARKHHGIAVAVIHWLLALGREALRIRRPGASRRISIISRFRAWPKVLDNLRTATSPIRQSA